MSVSMTKANGVTVLTLTSDPQSSCPPLCQIIKVLCYSPVWCDVSEHLRKVQRMSQSVLGALHIMVGLLNIGLGAILCNSAGGSSWQMDETLFPFWMGALFILFGIVCILSEKFPSRCLVIINVALNLAGVALANVAIILYSINIANIWLWWSCTRDDYEFTYKQDSCLEIKELTLMLLRSINAVLIVLSVLELCVTISSATLGIKALRSKETAENESPGDPELYKPLLEEVNAN